MKIIGLLGGIGSGKSTIAEMFRRLGAGVLDADKAGHEVLRLPAVRAAVGGHWGREVIGSDGEIDRKALASIVFAPPPDGPAALSQLEQMTHSEIRTRLRKEIDELASRGTQIVVLDAPVLLKAGWNAFCDALVFVDAPLAQRQARAAARGWTAEEFARREASQEPIEEKRRHADFVVDNSRDFRYISSQVERLWQELSNPFG
ncbi:MAG: dephospho-CoA kinase [Pirellulales bacterium]|nr:dephospho-CoA kinase [Pirellulales bacterium]